MSFPSASDGAVLLLEDEALIAVALQDDLEEAGYEVAGPFAACVDALAWLESNKPDLAILDTVTNKRRCALPGLLGPC
jgi:DNA-binding response OmpR family regulator